MYLKTQLYYNINPMTRQEINIDFFISNRALKNLIEEYKNENVIKVFLIMFVLFFIIFLMI
jgi:DNA-binding transcriptional regulator LsrR (DeoR family)